MSTGISATTSQSPSSEGDYPEQKHSGRVGLGPNYRRDADLSDKFEGLYEEAKGKVLHEPELIEHGYQRRTGELKRKSQHDTNENVFQGHEEKEEQSEEEHESPRAETTCT